MTTTIGNSNFFNEDCYTGGIYDVSTGLYYLNARYYDPNNGRFITQDTYRGEINNPSSHHLYIYCVNNPINYTDPSGHGPVGIVVGGIIGFGAGKLILPKIADRLGYKGKKRKWFINLGTAVMTVLGGAVGNYVGKAMVALYAKGGSVASTLNYATAKMFRKYLKGSIKSAKGSGWIIKFYRGSKEFTLRVMNSGGGRKNYMRLSNAKKGAVNISGKYVSDRGQTHIQITFNNLIKMVKLLKKL